MSSQIRRVHLTMDVGISTYWDLYKILLMRRKFILWKSVKNIYALLFRKIPILEDVLRIILRLSRKYFLLDNGRISATPKINS